jgi:hypothetical protein
MTDLEGMHSYFWLTSSRLREPIQDDVPYTTQALREDILRVRLAWEECQASRDRNAIYNYLSAVFDLVTWWAAEDRAISRAHWALELQHLDLPTTDEPFAAVILCTADRQKVDKRTRSKMVACCGTQRSTSRIPNRWPHSSGGRVALTDVPRGSPVVLGEVVETEL